MESLRTKNRFDYSNNLEKASTYKGYINPIWPPMDNVLLTMLNLQSSESISEVMGKGLKELRTLIEQEWLWVKQHNLGRKDPLRNVEKIAQVMRLISEGMPRPEDRKAMLLRADAMEHGYNDDILQSLTEIAEDCVVIAGKVSTWYGKEVAGLPTAFACRKNQELQAMIEQAQKSVDAIPTYLSETHKALKLNEIPVFAVTDIFFMAGEGNLHPKHVAYFLPEDEGVKRSVFKKTYYFSNTHHALIKHVSGPLAGEMLNVRLPFKPATEGFKGIPALGVFAHEIGHFVVRESTSYTSLNKANRWASVTLQEVAADVFGTLILAEVFAPAMDISWENVIVYYLAECLRYVHRGLGIFPDCDGMYLQLSYFLSLGALQINDANEPVLTGKVEDVLCGLRSLARVLTDTLLADNPEGSVALHDTYGPAGNESLAGIIALMGQQPYTSIEYQQEA